MGAGSAKGVNPENSEDADRFSTTSDQWEENDPPASRVEKENAKNNNTTIATSKVIAEAAIASTSKAAAVATAAHIENGHDSDKRKEEAKKKARFAFSRKKDDGDNNKPDDFGKGDTNEQQQAKKENGDIDTMGKKDTDKKGFRLFGWRKDDNKKSEEKDEVLDNDIDDLEKTFDSLGIVGKNMWGGSDTSKKKEGAVDDIELLEPMRKRKNVKVRGGGGKGINGTSTGSSGSNGSKRTFKFSWEAEGEKPMESEREDEWEYKAVVIEGFDIEKFRKANLKDSVFDSTSLPNTVGGEGGETTTDSKTPLRYDQTEQYILASIERDFTH